LLEGVLRCFSAWCSPSVFPLRIIMVSFLARN
jgi:hypothetical protein